MCDGEGLGLIQMAMTDEAYKLVKSTSGVTGFVQSGNKPVPLEEVEVRRIMSNLEASKEAPKVHWNKGDTIRVVEGPFSEFTGKIEEVNADREKLKVLINIFGGIMKCDVIAEGVVAAVNEVGLKIPLVVRLEGTNVDLGKKIIAESGLNVVSADDLDDAAQKIVKAVRGN